MTKKAGTDLVINMNEEDVVKIIKEKTDLKGVERIIEVNLNANFINLIRYFAQNGYIITYALRKANDEIALKVFTSMKKAISYRFVLHTMNLKNANSKH